MTGRLVGHPPLVLVGCSWGEMGKTMLIYCNPHQLGYVDILDIIRDIVQYIVHAVIQYHILPHIPVVPHKAVAEVSE